MFRGQSSDVGGQDRSNIRQRLLLLLSPRTSKLQLQSTLFQPPSSCLRAFVVQIAFSLPLPVWQPALPSLIGLAEAEDPPRTDPPKLARLHRSNSKPTRNLHSESLRGPPPRPGTGIVNGPREGPPTVRLCSRRPTHPGVAGREETPGSRSFWLMTRRSGTTTSAGCSSRRAW